MRATSRTLCILALCLGAGAALPAAAQNEREDAQDRLHQLIDRAIHAEGPFFTPSERALVERKCGMASGSWNGDNFNMSNGVMTCPNGRRIARDREIEAMMDVAGERISRRVNAVMRSAEIQAAISAVAREASARALAELGERRGGRRRY